MLIRLDCPRCGHSGDELADGRANSVSCVRCQARFALQLVPIAESLEGQALPSDDPPVASWLDAHRLPPAPPVESADATCVGCGYEGPMPLDLALNTPTCPACGRSHRAQAPGMGAEGRYFLPMVPPRYVPPPDPRRELPCPECGEPLIAERGKTVICPACNSFLGCLYAEAIERRHWWQG